MSDGLAFHRRECRAAPAGFEPLEHRIVLSTLTVTTLADAGPGSLRQAVADANAAPGLDTVRFAGGLTGTITLTSGSIAVTDDVEINGPGGRGVTVSGNNASRVFTTGAGADAAISRLTLANGRSDSPVLGAVPIFAGGAILNAGGRLTLDRTVFNNNTAAPAAGFPTSLLPAAAGGAVAVLAGGSLEVARCAFSGNSAAGFSLGTGGAIATDNGVTLDVEGSTFSGNSASAVLGTNPLNALLGSGFGGAITVGSGGTAVISRTAFTGNSATGGSGPGLSGGAGIGGAVFSTDQTLTGAAPAESTLAIEHSAFTANRARGGNGPAGLPGGVGAAAAVAVDGIRATIEHTVFTGNRAAGGDGGAGTGSGNGGAGGAGNAGAVVIGAQADLTVTHAAFVGNTSAGGSGGAGGPGGGSGGDGGQSSGGALTVLSSTADVSHTLFAGNSTTGGAGGAGSAGGNGGQGGAALGGAVVTLPGALSPTIPSTLHLSHVSLLLNAATGGAGGTGSTAGASGDARGGGLYLGLAAATLEHALVSANKATGGQGTPRGAGVGGGVYVNADSTAVFSRTRVRGNFASTSDPDVSGVLGMR